MIEPTSGFFFFFSINNLDDRRIGGEDSVTDFAAKSMATKSTYAESKMAIGLLC